MVEVIDHLLVGPEVKGPIELLRPSVYYKFADPALEDRSVGQKALIRMGPENAAIVQAKLRDLRQRIATRGLAADRVADRGDDPSGARGP
jgi:hypothetical protein